MLKIFFYLSLICSICYSCTENTYEKDLTGEFELYYCFSGLGSNIGSLQPVIRIEGNNLYYTKEQNSSWGEEKIKPLDVYIGKINQSAIDSIIIITQKIKRRSIKKDNNPHIMSGGISFLNISFNELTVKFELWNSFDSTANLILGIINSNIPSRVDKISLFQNYNNLNLERNSEVIKQEYSKIDSDSIKYFGDSKCTLFGKENKLRNVLEELGDTIAIRNVYRWVENLEPNSISFFEKNNIVSGDKYFEINKGYAYITIGALADEGEYLSVKAYVIDKSTCKIIDHVLLAETTASEGSWRDAYSIFRNEFNFSTVKTIGYREEGNYNKIHKDTIIVKGGIHRENGRIYKNK